MCIEIKIQAKNKVHNQNKNLEQFRRKLSSKNRMAVLKIFPKEENEAFMIEREVLEMISEEKGFPQMIS